MPDATCGQSGDSSELASRLPCKGKSVRNRGVSQTMPFLVIPRSLLRGGFITPNPAMQAERVVSKNPVYGYQRQACTTKLHLGNICALIRS
jgi:hypothetical protein